MRRRPAAATTRFRCVTSRPRLVSLATVYQYCASNDHLITLARAVSSSRMASSSAISAQGLVAPGEGPQGESRCDNPISQVTAVVEPGTATHPLGGRERPEHGAQLVGGCHDQVPDLEGHPGPAVSGRGERNS